MTTSIDLLFVADPAIDGRLVFGEPPIGANIPPVDATLTGTFAAMAFAAQAVYDPDVQRPTVGQAAAHWQQGAHARADVLDAEREATPHVAPVSALWRAAQRIGTPQSAAWLDAAALRSQQSSRWQDAGDLARAAIGRAQDASRTARTARGGRFSDATSARVGWLQELEDAQRLRQIRLSRWQSAAAASIFYSAALGPGAPVRGGWAQEFQDARHAPPGVRSVPLPPGAAPCYTPDPHLLFRLGPAPDGRLLFICSDTPPPAVVVVPVRRVYIVINDTSLRRVDGDIQLPTFSMSLSLDYQSWTWGLQASLPADQLGNLQPAGGVPVEVEASINGTPIRFIVGRRTRSRTFGQASISITGRGKAALLDAPYAPVQSFANGEARTAQQLMGDVLTLNGVPLGWSVEWGLTDWNVPADVFAHQGTYISALNAIAAAAGGYVQPHATAQTLRVLPLYPVAPWDWGTVPADIEIPAAVATQEGVEWIEKPAYNRVFVSGTRGGVLARVTRDGTAGDRLAPMVVDPLITEAAAGRQRGAAILADTGVREDVTLRLPVLAETGIILPGKMIDYVDDASVTRRGITRGVQVSVGGLADVWQNILVETRNA